MAPSLVDNMLDGEVVGKRQLTYKIFEIDVALRKPEHISFVAGQFAMFVAGEKIRRAYSIISSPAQTGVLSFCVDISPMGPGSLLVRDVCLGGAISLQAPFGALTVTDSSKDLLFVATGAGIAPFRCIITELLAGAGTSSSEQTGGFNKKITLLFGNHSEAELFYIEYFAQLARAHANFEFIPTLSQAGHGWQGATGRVTELLSATAGTYTDRLVYICGNGDMIKEVKAQMLSVGVAKTDIKVEVFH